MTRAIFRGTALTLAVSTLTVACAPDRGEQAISDTVATSATATPPAADTVSEDMAGMPGMGGGSLTEQMQAHLRMLDGATADSMKAMLPMHRQMLANMISQFDREMRQMNMKSDAAWQATLDSLRQDNLRLPEMSTAELRSFMPAHGGRVSRLMDMHKSMMAKM